MPEQNKHEQLIVSLTHGKGAEMLKTLPKEKADQMLAVAQNAAAFFPEAFNKSSPAELYQCFAKATYLGLLPNANEAIIVRVGGKTQLWVMTNGARKIIANHPDVAEFAVEPVYDLDELEIKLLSTERPVLTTPDPFNRGDLVGVVGYAKLKNGQVITKAISLADAKMKYLPQDKKKNPSSFHYSDQHPADWLANCLFKSLARLLPPVDPLKPNSNDIWSPYEKGEGDGEGAEEANAAIVVAVNETPPTEGAGEAAADDEELKPPVATPAAATGSTNTDDQVPF